MSDVPWIDVVEGDGYRAGLLNRYPSAKAIAIQIATERDQAITQALAAKVEAGTIKGSTWTGWADAVLRNSLEWFEGTDYLTGEKTDDIGAASEQVYDELSLRAIENYLKWFRDTQPAPKGSSGTAGRTRSGAKASSPSETVESS